MIDTYTRLLETTAEVEETDAANTAVTRLIAHLKSTGRMRTLPRIVRELERVAARRVALRAIVEVASKEEGARALHASERAGISTKRFVVNPSLIRGWRARENGRLIDRSAKRALVQIYQRVAGTMPGVS